MPAPLFLNNQGEVSGRGNEIMIVPQNWIWLLQTLFSGWLGLWLPNIYPSSLVSNSPVYHSHPPSQAWLQYSPGCQGMLASDPPPSDCGWRCPRGWPWRGWWCWQSQSATAPPAAAPCPGWPRWWRCDCRPAAGRRRWPPRSWKSKSRLQSGFLSEVGCRWPGDTRTYKEPALRPGWCVQFGQIRGFNWEITWSSQFRFCSFCC